MTPTERSLVKVAIPLAAVVIIFLRTRGRLGGWRNQLAVNRVTALQVLMWLAPYVLWMLGTNYFMNWRGDFDFAPWRAAPLASSVLRVLAVGILGPAAEELLFRGYLFTLLRERGMNGYVAIVLLALIWAFIHPYSIAVNAVIFVAGILLGLARYSTKSVVPPIIMHVVWNLFAVW